MKRRIWLVLFVVVALIAASCGDDDDDGGAEDGATTTAAAEDGATTTAAAEDGATTTAAADGGDGTDGGTAGALDLEAVLAADLANCDEPTGDPLIIGYAADLSEVGGFADGPASAAAEFFVELVNCAGGVNGSPVELIVQDIQGDPEVTQRAAQDLLDAGSHAILGPPFADFGLPLLQVTQGEVPVVFVASTEPSLPDVEVLSFLSTFDDTKQAEAAAEFALEQGFETAITFSSPGPYFGYNPEVFTEAFEAGGGTLVSDYSYVPFEDTDFSTQANEIAGLSEVPDVLYTAMIADQIAILRGQLEALGIELDYIGADAFEATGITVVDNNEGVYYTTHAFAGEGTPLATFLDRYEEETGEAIENGSFAGLAADAIIVIADAFVRSGSTDPVEIGAAIAETDGLETMTGSKTYAGTNGVPERPVFVHQIVDGEVTLAGTIG